MREVYIRLLRATGRLAQCVPVSRVRARALHSAVYLVLSFTTSLVVAVEIRSFEEAELARRYRALTQELRCLVCQNQSLADSNAALAQDPRDRVHAMLVDGRDDGEVRDFVVARYGDFILYDPPLSYATALLWTGPWVMVALVAAWLRWMRRKGLCGVHDQGQTLDEEERQLLSRLTGASSDDSRGLP